MRRDSSASSNQTASSAIPSSVEARQTFTPKNSRLQTSDVNGHANTTPKPELPRAERTPSFGMRARSASLQKGVAVLKAMSRAPQDGDDYDSGYDFDKAKYEIGAVPGKIGEEATEGEVSPAILSEEAKKSGRINREGLRKRQDDRMVEKMVGNRASGGNGSEKKEKRRAKSWEIPRKVFHSSIGECNREAVEVKDRSW
jgi:hypothetical protein